MNSQHSSQRALQGKAILVTGGGSGIGLACAQRLAYEGAAITLCGRSEQRLRNAAAEIDAASGGAPTAQWIACDVVNEDQVKAAINKALEATGALDGIVASAGGGETLAPLTLTPTDLWRHVLEVNLTGTFFAIKHGVPHMARRGGGSFVAISSIAGHLTHRFFGPYTASKAGIEALVRNAADEFGASGVRVNCVCPGLVETGPVEAITQGGAVLEDYLSQMPLGRVGKPADIAALVNFLIGNESSWITGQVISADGGHSLRRGPDLTPFASFMHTPEALRGMVGEGDV